jgi:ABC-type uncharacterized transport system ATPase subunit
MFDVEELCRRCIIIDHGKTIYAGDIATLKANEKTKVVEIEVLAVVNEKRFQAALERCEVLERSASQYKLQVETRDAVEVIGELFEACRLSNLNVVPPALESIVEKIFQAERRGREQHVA